MPSWSYKITWRSGNTYDCIATIATANSAKVSGATNLYGSFFYVMNSEYRFIFVCRTERHQKIQIAPSLEPTFVDLEPRAAGASGDGYIWEVSVYYQSF